MSWKGSNEIRDGVAYRLFAGSRNVFSRVESSGGKVLQGKTLITEEIGYMAVVLDTEGNRIALHSRK